MPAITVSHAMRIDMLAYRLPGWYR